MRLTPFAFSNSTLVRTSKVRHWPAAGVSARAATALERAQPAQIELFARKKSRRFIIRLEDLHSQQLGGPAPRFKRNKYSSKCGIDGRQCPCGCRVHNACVSVPPASTYWMNSRRTKRWSLAH